MKKVLAALLVMLMLIPVGFAYAAPTKEEIQNFKTQVKAKLEVMKQNKEALKQLKESAKAKTQQMKADIKEMRKNKETFTLDQLDNIEALVKVVKEDMAAIKKLDSFFVTYERFRTNKKNFDFTAALGNLDNVIKIQTDRKAAFEKLNTDLDAILTALK